jgi:serine/threonine protein kinase
VVPTELIVTLVSFDPVNADRLLNVGGAKTPVFSPNHVLAFALIRVKVKLGVEDGVATFVVNKGDRLPDEKFVRRFQREALSASNLYHPNIVQIYDFDSEDGQYYIVMEYVEGKTLKQLLGILLGLALMVLEF